MFIFLRARPRLLLFFGSYSAGPGYFDVCSFLQRVVALVSRDRVCSLQMDAARLRLLDQPGGDTLDR